MASRSAVSLGAVCFIACEPSWNSSVLQSHIVALLTLWLPPEGGSNERVKSPWLPPSGGDSPGCVSACLSDIVNWGDERTPRRAVRGGGRDRTRRSRRIARAGFRV